MYELLLFAFSIGAGFLGAILGIGGGFIVVPTLTLLLNIDIRYAVAASLVSIVATSSGAAASYLKDHLTNLRVVVFLEIGTVFGAIVGFLISSYISSTLLYFMFAGFLLFSVGMMLRQREDHISTIDHPISKRLKFASHYPGPDGKNIFYSVVNVNWGLLLMFIAGINSALLGIGSGVLKVMAMDGAMKLPMKVSSATSNFMIGVTAIASAGAYFIKGDIHPQIAAPVALGIIIGSWLGAKVMLKMQPRLIRIIFIILMLSIAVQMVYKGFNP